MSKMQMSHLVTLAEQAGALIHKCHFEPDSMGIEWKADQTPLTVADRGVRDLVNTYMTEHFSHIPVIGEEAQLGKRTGADDEEWMLIDEVDGTWAYMLQVPVYSSLFAVMRGNRPVMSAIVDPVGKRLYTAERGAGAFRNGKQITTAEFAHTQKTPAVGFVSWPHRDHPSDMLVKGLVRDVVVGIHEMGAMPVSMITIGYLDAMVADGRLAGSIFPAGSMHDTAAGHLLVEEAGGVATDLSGSSLDYSGTKLFGHIFAGNEEMHQKLVRLVADSIGPFG